MSPPKFSSLRYPRRRTSSLIPFRDDLGLIGLRYEKTAQAEPPILIPAPRSLKRSVSVAASSPTTTFSISSTSSIPPPPEEHPALRGDLSSVGSREEWNGDSGVTQTTSTSTSTSSTIYEEDFDTTILFDKELELATHHSAVEHVELVELKPAPTDSYTSSDRANPFDSQAKFSPISVSIPTDSLLGEDFLTNVSFSKRGSLMFGGTPAFIHEEKMPEPSIQTATPRAFPLVTSSRRASDRETQPEHSAATANAATADEVLPARPRQPIPNIRLLPADVERDSQKVRSLYDVGDDINWEQGAPVPTLARDRLSPTPEDPVEKDKHNAPDNAHNQTLMPERATSGSADSSLQPPDLVRREYELAGGVEDWQDVDGADVDRYGFIRPRRQGTASEKTSRPSSRRRNLLSRRDPSQLNSARVPNRKVSARSLHTQASELSAASFRSSLSTLRHATNLLPHNRDRRLADEAGEMLTHTPGIQHITEDEKADKISEAVKRKEWERAGKWRRMAKVVRKGKDGEGMEFEFDIKHPKLVERTWKGIPDRWRGAAWYSFLATSAKARKDSPTEEYLISEFRRLQLVSCEDDVQIDLDVPRTINKHIMFRSRYRGGQRLLFRVLHAVALYYSEIGYVQGMASLAATLLCYFDEEKAFIMIVRMWHLRGLEHLYQHGFAGLMACLQDLEKRWLAGKDVGKRLNHLGIDGTVFGTKWYLTLFNLAIPFPAQLRIWDVFLLLGDTPPQTPGRDGAPAGLDVLHAASTAIIDALSEIILDSDFDNTMKILTSWIPIKDEDLLMKVAKAELKYKGEKKA
ncbi:related to Rab6 GTPase activating protein, GAPCenA [Cephalotrichum gorgonifer]|uniref:Related to Rab6 GTPase activating protein, GAPCenA n=1 Tax=Cephalotrichum gorgonifer TaxID=2041049 RepID=A0AAE8N1W6_9PEZI|nr:related to Rab6 GTPase activating protein, GAPCenA [Cephalotrichum gorgonifer]